MSSYVVEDKTINKVVEFLSLKILSGDVFYAHTADKLLAQGYDLATHQGRVRLAVRMFALNVRAVDERYGRDEAKEFRPLDFEYTPLPRPTAVEAYKALACWRYQCSEGNVPETRLYKLMEDVRNDIAHNIVSALPDYDAAPWG